MIIYYFYDISYRHIVVSNIDDTVTYYYQAYIVHFTNTK